MKHLMWILVLLVACESKPPSDSANTVEPKSEVVAQEVAATEGKCDGPMEELYAMDPRKPVPLQPMMAWHQKQNMMEHLVAIQLINKGVAEEDWEGVLKAVDLIGSSPQMAKMCEHMGAGAEGFTPLALEFHARADTIREPAQKKDILGTIRATASTLETCTSCHAAYRQDVVDAKTWQERTGSNHEPMHHGHH